METNKRNQNDSLYIKTDDTIELYGNKCRVCREKIERTGYSFQSWCKKCRSCPDCNSEWVTTYRKLNFPLGFYKCRCMNCLYKFSIQEKL